MAALGSSFAAGPGLRPVTDRAAGRSARNYPHLVAQALGAELVDATVSGATTANLLREPQRVGLRRFPPQVECVSSTTDLVTITAGGNDLGYIGGLTSAALHGWLIHRPLIGAVRRAMRSGQLPAPPDDAAIERATRGLVDVVAAVRERAPAARVLLVDYLTVLGPSSRPSRELPVTAEAIAHFADVGRRVAVVFSTAARRSGAELVQASALSADHAIGSAAPWVEGFTAPGLLRGPASFHPGALGMQAVAEAVLRTLAPGGTAPCSTAARS